MEPVSTLVKSLSNLLRYFQHERHQSENIKRLRRKDLEDAMLATHQAILESKKYLDPLQGKDLSDLQAARSRDTEYRLSELWAISAIRSSKFMDSSPDYAKARDWLDGIKWESWEVRSERIRSLGISLEQMQDRLEAMMTIHQGTEGGK